MLSFNDDVTSFKKEETGGVVFMRFPIYNNGAFLANHEPGMAIVRMEIEDHPDNVFVINHFLCNSLLQYLHKHYPMSKIVFVIHDQTWANALMGDFKKLQMIVNGTITDNAVKHGFDTEKTMYQLANHVICMNADTQRLLEEVYCLEKDRIHFIPNGLEPPTQPVADKLQTRKLLYIPPTDKIIVYAGRTTKCKGIDDLLVAFNEVAKQYPEARLIVLGEVFRHPELANLCQEAISRVTFAGLVSKEKLVQWYSIADVGVVPSYCEQCGYTGAEMMSMRIPVVASDALGVRCMFEDGKTGFVAPIGNREYSTIYQHNIATAIIRTLEIDNRTKQTVLDNAFNLYLSRYSLESMKEGYTQLFKSI